MPSLRNVLIVTGGMLLLSSCYTYKVYPKTHRNYVYTGSRKKAYISHPGLAREYRILKAAHLFSFTTDGTDTAALIVQLRPMERGFVCGQAITASMITLGQLPVLLPDRYQYRFNVIQRGDTVKHYFELDVATRYWFWDLFSFKKNFTGKAGQTLAAQY